RRPPSGAQQAMQIRGPVASPLEALHDALLLLVNWQTPLVPVQNALRNPAGMEARGNAGHGAAVNAPGRRWASGLGASPVMGDPEVVARFAEGTRIETADG